MTKRGTIRQTDLQRIFRAAKASGSTVQIDLKNQQVTVFPFSPPEAQVLSAIFPDKRDSDWDDSNGLESWDEPPSAPKGRGGYPIPQGDDHPLKVYYDRIGFNPKTMNEADMKRLMAEADARWRDEIPSQPMNKLECKVLLQLLSFGQGAEVPWRSIKGCGPDTQERLDARGFIEMRMQTKFPDRISAFILTRSGWEAACGLKNDD